VTLQRRADRLLVVDDQDDGRCGWLGHSPFTGAYAPGERSRRRFRGAGPAHPSVGPDEGQVGDRRNQARDHGTSQ
jgi:hypothetical protein